MGACSEDASLHVWLTDVSRLKACVHAHTRTHTHTHTRTHARTHIHTHTHTYTHTRISAHKAHTSCQFTAHKASPTFQHRLRCFPPLVFSILTGVKGESNWRCVVCTGWGGLRLYYSPRARHAPHWWFRHWHRPPGHVADWQPINSWCHCLPAHEVEAFLIILEPKPASSSDPCSSHFYLANFLFANTVLQELSVVNHSTLV